MNSLCILALVQLHALPSSDMLRISAMAVVESGMQEHITSSAGAMGPMQLMPIAIKELQQTQTGACKPPKTGWQRMVQTYEYGILWGSCYVAHLEQLGYYDVELLLSYNAGPGWVKRWRKTGRMPRESVNYIRKVMEIERTCSATGGLQ